MAISQVSLGQVKQAWRSTAPQRGYNFGFNLKTLRPTVMSLRTWFSEARSEKVENRPGLTVVAYVTPVHLYVVGTEMFRGVNGLQEVHWAKPGSHTGATHAEPVLEDYPSIEGVLVDHSEIIADNGRTLEQAAAQVRMALDATVEGRTFKFITICVGESRGTYDMGRAAAVAFVQDQASTILSRANVQPGEMGRIGFAYEPRFAIQVGDVPGIPPSDEHIRVMGWTILETVAGVVGLEGMSKMFTLQYGGSMKGPENTTAPVQRFVGPGNKIDEDLFNGGLIGTAGKDPATAAAILNRIVPIREEK